MTLDAILIHPGASQEIYQGLANDYAAIEQPLWTRLNAAYLRQHGFSVLVIDADAERISPKTVADIVYVCLLYTSSQSLT